MEGRDLSDPLASAGPGKVVSHRRAARLNVARSSSSAGSPGEVRGRGSHSGNEGKDRAMVEAVEVPVVIPPVPRRYDSSIVEAVASDDRSLVFSLHQQGISLESTNRGGLTVLIAAVNWNRDDIVEFCLSHNCNIDAKGNNGCTALHIAAFWGRENLVRMLMVRGGANETLIENGGHTPLKIARAMNKSALVAAWEGISIQATAARKERERQAMEDQMFTALLCMSRLSVSSATDDDDPSDDILPNFCVEEERCKMMLPIMSILTGFTELEDMIEGL